MIIAIDSGNTVSKVGVFRNGSIVKTYEKRTYGELIQLVKDLNPDRIIVSTVKIPVEKFIRDIPAARLFLYNHNTPLPIRVQYATPSTLGLDRIALSAGAWNEFPGRNLLIISAGTCITYDFINDQGEYLGGSISPGLHMRLKSLHHYTANLPLIDLVENAPLIGTSTESSILSGVIHGTLTEISGFIHQYQEKFKDIQVIFSGGDVKFFESKLKDHIFAIPNLVLKGIYSIFSYNENPA
ncbi:MAG: type III pantothenate kinase [Cyclobacteriaceae bacterium]|nr:type III pantothenate kinase [Cyclobacteriaceae bacterium]